MPPHEFRNKKRKLDRDGDGADFAQSKHKRDDSGVDHLHTAKPSARFIPNGGREWTVSVAVPASIIADCATSDQRMNSPGRLARALAVFSVDEVVIFDDSPVESRPAAVDTTRYTGDTDPCHFIEHVLSYLETPPFMRKALFPLHPNLRLAGQLPSLDMPHHPHINEWLPFREGFTINGKTRDGKGTLVDIGMKTPVSISDEIPVNTRVTLKFTDDSRNQAEPVHPAAPRTEDGYYWGYSVRRCGSLSSVFTESPHEGGYDLSIGTSERGQTISRAFPATKTAKFNHLLIVFGGPRGLEYAAMNDSELRQMEIQGGRTRELFDHWINVLPGQGSRTIRSDEAVFIALTGLRRLWDAS